MMTIRNASNNTKSSKLPKNLNYPTPKRTKSEKPSRFNNERFSGSYLSDHQKNCIKLFKSFEKLCVTYNDIPNIEIEKAKRFLSEYNDFPNIELEKSKKSQDKSTEHEKTKFKGKNQEKISYIITQLKKRIKQYPELESVCIPSYRFPIITQTGEKVGPGTYETREEKSSESHEFSSIPRLKSPLSHNIFYLEKLCPRRLPNSDIIKKNMHFAKNPSISKEIHESSFMLKRRKEEEIRKIKRKMDESLKVERSMKIDKKFRTFEWRKVKHEASKVVKSWSCLIVIWNFVKLLNKRKNTGTCFINSDD